MSRLVLGTRGSELARAQASLVETALRAKGFAGAVAIEIVKTSGDERSGASPEPPDRHAGRKGMFTREIERALLNGEIDVAVHSAKDLPSEASPGLEICAALPRASVEDVLIAKGAGGLSALRNGGTVATGSVRRRHQLRWLRPDLEIVELRGNVPTRLRKLMANTWDAAILARAGLERLGFHAPKGEIEFEGRTLQTSILSVDEFLPAGGQGIIALQIRSDDDASRHVMQGLNDYVSFRCLRAEREFLRLLQGDCDTPVGVLATVRDGTIEMRAQIFETGRAQPLAAALRNDDAAIGPETTAAELFKLIHGG